MASTAHLLELILNSRLCAWSFLALDEVNMQMFSLLATSSRIKIIYGHLDDCSVFFQNRESGFYFTRILAVYTTKMYLCAPDELGIFQRITEWARTINHPGCSHVLRFHDSFQLKCVSMSALMVIILNLLIKYKQSSQLFLGKMNNHLFHLWNIDQGNCLRLLILFVTWSIHLTLLIWIGYRK